VTTPPPPLVAKMGEKILGSAEKKFRESPKVLGKIPEVLFFRIFF